MEQETLEKTICCPEFDPAPWNEKIVEWNNKKFIKDRVRTLFYMPVNFGSVMRRLNHKVEQQHATIPDWMGLSDHVSKWNMDIYLAVDRDISNANNTTISGKFATKVYEGPYKETGNWSKNFQEWCSNKGFHPVKHYIWYTTCPKCAKKYGKNYVVFLAKLGEQ